MVNVGLICAAGISSQIIINNVKSIVEKEKLDFNFQAITVDEVNDKFNIILLTPQVEYLIKKIKQLVDNSQVIIEVIPSEIYANNNAEKLINFAKELLKK